MKRVSFLTATAAALVLAAVANPVAARACQYCRMATFLDPEAPPADAAIQGGAFPLDVAISKFQTAPASADLKTAPTAGSVATSASALTAPGLAGADGVPAPVVHRPVLAPAPVAAAVNSPAKAVPVTDSSRVNVVVAHWTDACLLGLVAAGGIFCWRTRRNQA